MPTNTSSSAIGISSSHLSSGLLFIASSGRASRGGRRQVCGGIDRAQRRQQRLGRPWPRVTGRAPWLSGRGTGQPQIPDAGRSPPRSSPAGRGRGRASARRWCTRPSPTGLPGATRPVPARAPAASAARCPARGRGAGSRARCRRPARRRSGAYRFCGHGASARPVPAFRAGERICLRAHRPALSRAACCTAAVALRGASASTMRTGSQRRVVVLRRPAAMSSRIIAPDSTSCSCSRVGGIGRSPAGRSRRLHSARAGGRRRWPAR